MKSIQTKLIVIILGVFLVALSALGGLNYWKARQIITNNVVEDMQAVAVSSAQDVSNWLATRKAELEFMALAPAVQSGNPEAILPYLSNIAKTKKIYENIGFADPTGKFHNSLGKTGTIAQRDYFKQAITSGETIVSDPVVSVSTGHSVIVVCSPVKVGGKIIGAIYGGINMTELANKVSAIKVGQSGYALVAQKDGLTIIHPDPNIAMKVNPLTDPKADSGRKAVTERIIKGEKGMMTIQAQGIDRYYAYAPVPGIDWGLAVTVPVGEVTGELTALTRISLATITTVLVLVALVVAWIARRIARPIEVLEAAADRIAAGEISLTKLSIASNDEIGRLGRSFERMTRNLHNLVQKIVGATEQVAASAQELTASSEQSARAANQISVSITEVAAGANEQLQAANETSVVVEQMSSSIQRIAANANQVAAQSAQATDKAKCGDKAVTEAVAQMDRIEDTVITSAGVVAKLGERSNEIGLIVDTIAGLAGQTNLLALNAAIEAARAGEQGRGFAVVAEEVRKLAEQSQDAAKKIAELIGEIRSDTDKAVLAMNEGTREVKVGSEVVTTAGTTFREIAELVAQVSSQVKEISAAMQQFVAGSHHVVESVKKIDGICRNSAGESQSVSAAAEEQLASMEEIASSSQSLAKLSQDLQSAVAEFRI